jgi:hypothetical protein
MSLKMAETTKTIKQEADALFASGTHNVLWANPAGEFFTTENMGNLSLKKGQRLTKYERSEKAVKLVDDIEVNQ